MQLFLISSQKIRFPTTKIRNVSNYNFALFSFIFLLANKIKFQNWIMAFKKMLARFQIKI